VSDTVMPSSPRQKKYECPGEYPYDSQALVFVILGVRHTYIGTSPGLLSGMDTSGFLATVLAQDINLSPPPRRPVKQPTPSV